MFKRYCFILIVLTLTACGGSGSEEAPPVPEPTPVPQPIPDPPPIPEPEPLPSKNESARFLNTASFGANVSSIESVSSIGFEDWLVQQITLPASSHVAYLQALEPTLNLGPDEELRRRDRLEAWYTHAITAPDQLRQRVAFALSEIFVVSDRSIFSQDIYGLANYYDLLINNAFGNYRDLLEQITLSPIMGMYLSVLGNQKPINK